MEWLQTLRQMKALSGLTTREIAERSGIPEPTLEKLFAGVTKEPKLTTLQPVVRCLGFSLDELDSGIHPEKTENPSDAVQMENPLLQSIVENFYQLNVEGQQSLAMHATMMVHSGLYSKHSNILQEMKNA